MFANDAAAFLERLPADQSFLCPRQVILSPMNVNLGIFSLSSGRGPQIVKLDIKLVPTVRPPNKHHDPDIFRYNAQTPANPWPGSNAFRNSNDFQLMITKLLFSKMAMNLTYINLSQKPSLPMLHFYCKPISWRKTNPFLPGPGWPWRDQWWASSRSPAGRQISSLDLATNFSPGNMEIYC